jgi:hypothetical protein
LLPVSAEAQTIVRSFEELTPGAAEIGVVIKKAAQETRSGTPEVSFESSEALAAPASLWPTPMARGWLERVAEREVPRLTRSTAFADSPLRARQQPGPQKRSSAKSAEASWSASSVRIGSPGNGWRARSITSGPDTGWRRRHCQVSGDLASRAPPTLVGHRLHTVLDVASRGYNGEPSWAHVPMKQANQPLV